MLSASEMRWWPLAPLLLAQGLYVRLATERLPPAGGERGRVGSGPGRLRLVGVGDSIIAGVGVRRMSDGLVGQLAVRIAEQGDATVEWLAVGESGATITAILESMLDGVLREAPSLVVISAGVNDAVAGTAPATFKRRLREIVDKLAAHGGPAVAFAGIPPMSSFPALPQPLATLLGRRAMALAAAAAELAEYRALKVVAFPATLRSDGFARDGFHPGLRACKEWSCWVAEALAVGPGRFGD